MRLQVTGGIGDEICLNGLIREIHRVQPDMRISATTGRFPEVLLHNPYLSSPDPSDKPIHLATQQHETIGNIVVSYGKQTHMKIYDNSPALYLAETELHKYQLPHKPVIAIDTFAGWPSRRWKEDNYMELGTRLMKNNIYVIHVGKQIPDCYGTVSSFALPCDLSLINKTTIRECGSLLSDCDLFIGGDSGLFHVAAAVKTKQVVLFSQKKWYSRAYNTTYSLYAYDECLPSCKETCMNTRHCLDTITVDDVMRMVDIALEAN